MPRIESDTNFVSPDSFEMIEVKSSTIQSIGYIADKKAMQIRFGRSGLSGPLYQYFYVDQDIADQLFAANQMGLSVGKTFAALVRKNAAIPYIRVVETYNA